MTPIGSAKDIDCRDLIRSTRKTKDLRCPGFEPTFHFDGNIYPCCSPSVFETELVVGKVGENTVKNAMANISHNAYFSIIRNEGFGWLSRKAAEYGLIPDSNKVRVVDVCELCARLSSNQNFLRSIAPSLISHASALYKNSRSSTC